eukprot:4590439-Pleurochrysis_carterae.AAC.1
MTLGLMSSEASHCTFMRPTRVPGTPSGSKTCVEGTPRQEQALTQAQARSLQGKGGGVTRGGARDEKSAVQGDAGANPSARE